MDTLQFDVVAKVPPDATKDQFNRMLQRLLAERFKLALHHEPKELDTFDLVIAKGGPKLKESVGDAPDIDPPAPELLVKDKDGRYPVRPGSIVFQSVNGGTVADLNAVRETMWSLAGRLAPYAGRPVFDATGLKGEYDFTLSWSPDPATAAEAAAPTGPSIQSALQTQLGLKLEPRKRKVDILILDHAEKTPTEN